MLFRLKNATTTYLRRVDRVFTDLTRETIEVFVDDMVVKSKTELDHIANLDWVFKLLWKRDLKLSPENCSFEVHYGKFLRFMRAY